MKLKEIYKEQKRLTLFTLILLKILFLTLEIAEIVFLNLGKNLKSME